MSWGNGLIRVAWSVVVFVVCTCTARAEPLLEVSAKLAATPLGSSLSVLKDESGALTLADVRARGSDFVPTNTSAPGFGLSNAVFWLRFEVTNSASKSARWLLEVGYPHLDHVSLFVPDETGHYGERRTGDSLPFDSRELFHRTFLFGMETPAKKSQTHYLRVQTSGSVSVPLLAWNARSFIAHQNRELPGYWLFYGTMAIMALYNLMLFAMIRRIEYLYYVLYNVSLLVFELALAGHAFQYLFPNDTFAANHVLVASIGMNYVWTSAFSRSYLDLATNFPLGDRLLRIGFWVALAVSCFAMVGPYALSLRLVIVVAIVLTLFALVYTAATIRRGARAGYYFMLAWTTLILGVLATLLKTIGVLPPSFLTEWGIQLGAGLESVLLSLALADRITTMQKSVATLNGELTQRVSDMRHALVAAESAMRAKDEFLATVSHELRTPLNAIINIPQGLLDDFKPVREATCVNCSSVFELAEDEHLTAETACPDCATPSALKVLDVRKYSGDIERSMHHLGTVERAGKHLLQMVNSVLDFSKMEAGKLTLDYAEVDVRDLVTDAVAQLAPLAARSGLRVVAASRLPHAPLIADATRLRQILFNLLGNAIKFSPADTDIEIGVQLKQQVFTFFVRDQGIGIAREHHERIFQSFEQVDRGDTRKYGGTGLGLSISASLVHMHGGAIWVESSAGCGSTFYFSIPHAPLRAHDHLLPSEGALPEEPSSVRVRATLPSEFTGT